MKRRWLIAVGVSVVAIGGSVGTLWPFFGVSPAARPSVTQIAGMPQVVALAPVVTPFSGCQSRDGLPDRNCTPGAIDPHVTQTNLATTICSTGYTRIVRPPVSVTANIKAGQMVLYGLKDASPADYELDHLISLELGGAPTDEANLWPQAWDGPLGARVKDRVENWLRSEVCAGRMTLADAQHGIAIDWRQYIGKP